MPVSRPGSITDVVSSAEHYPSFPPPNETSELPSSSPHIQPRAQRSPQPASMSSNPVVNIKYDAILSSSAAKGLALSPEFRPPPTPTVDADADADIDDARTPPNSPVGTVPAHQSLMAAAFGITSVGRMSREDEEEGVKVERGSDLERVGP